MDPLRIASSNPQFFEYVAGLYYYHTKEVDFFNRTVTACTASTLPTVIDPVTKQVTVLGSYGSGYVAGMTIAQAKAQLSELVQRALAGALEQLDAEARRQLQEHAVGADLPGRVVHHPGGACEEEAEQAPGAVAVAGHRAGSVGGIARRVAVTDQAR